ncbi:ribonucleoside-diphosphate reductase subunit alpha [Patescibacteria group bacterium]|nr:ribonucleoside-diphosphate reductase subunit alpha [Patescibacteria group bacterium]
MGSLQRIKKRDGRVVAFDAGKITQALFKAFTSVRGGSEPTILERLMRDVVADLEARVGADGVSSIEEVQNVVEQILMRDGFFDIAKHYILYRYEHAKIREQKPQTFQISVVKRSGATEPFAIEKVRRTLEHVAKDAGATIDIETIAQQCAQDVYDGMKTSDLAQALILTTRAFIERDPAYSKMASRLLAHKVYKEAHAGAFDFSKLDEYYRSTFIKNIQTLAELKKLDERMVKFDLERLASVLKPERDDLFMFLGMQTIADRYFLNHPTTKQVLETPQAFWMRVAMGLALNETRGLRDDTAIRFYELISTLRFVPSTPTLFHAGTSHPQLSSCYLTTVMDSLDHIFKCLADNAQLSKWSGGLGNDWTNLRGTGSRIKGTGVDSQGIIPFLKVANDTTAAINRSGRRRGATCAYLETWHYDIEDFLELRKNTGDERRRTHDMDTANWIPDLFMKRVRADKDWTLFSPDEVPDLHHIFGKKFEEQYENYERLAEEGKIRLHRKVKARDLWKKMLGMLFETGHPWITWKDPCNVRSPQDHVGVIHSSNLCTEITLNTSADETAVCNLGSVNVGRHITNGKLDLEMLKETVTIAMRMLDNVIDVNFYPTIEAERANMRHRPVGLGIMGFQDALYALDINFASEACVKFADESMEAVSFYALLASSELAKERGVYASYEGSKWDRGILPLDTVDLLEQERGERIDVSRSTTLDWSIVRAAIKKHGMRNSNCLAIAPTATISNISGCTPSIEPIYKNLYVKANQFGDFIVINGALVDDLKKLNMWDDSMLKKLKYFDGNIAQIEEIPATLREKYKETFDIEPQWLIRAAAARGKWMDQSQALNIFYKGASGKEISDIYMYAWELGVKTTYYLRTLAASQVEKSTVSTAEFGSTHKRATSKTSDTPAVNADTHDGAPTPRVTVAAAEANPMAVKTVPIESKTSPTVMIDGKEIKLCKINDPTCEACQ